MAVRDDNLAHGNQADADHDREIPEVDLLSPLTMRGVRLPNRIVMSPMCQYCATEGLADDWHLVHLGSRAVGGVGLIVVEATAVTRDGRISPADLGIWGEEHVEPLARIARFVRRMGKVAGSYVCADGPSGTFTIDGLESVERAIGARIVASHPSCSVQSLDIAGFSLQSVD